MRPASSRASSVISIQSPGWKLRTSSLPVLCTVSWLAEPTAVIAVTAVATEPLSRDHLNVAPVPVAAVLKVPA